VYEGGREVLPSLVAYGLGPLDVKGLFEHPLGDVGRRHLPNEEGVVPALVTGSHPALQVGDALPNEGRLHPAGWDRGQAGLPELVVVPAGDLAAEDHLPHQPPRGDVDHELPGLPDQAVGVPPRGDADDDHGRPGGDGHVHPEGDDVRPPVGRGARGQDHAGGRPDPQGPAQGNPDLLSLQPGLTYGTVARAALKPFDQTGPLRLSVFWAGSPRWLGSLSARGPQIT